MLVAVARVELELKVDIVVGMVKDVVVVVVKVRMVKMVNRTGLFIFCCY